MSDWLLEATRAARDVGSASPAEVTATRARLERSVRSAGRAWRLPAVGIAAALLLSIGGAAAVDRLARRDPAAELRPEPEAAILAPVQSTTPPPPETTPAPAERTPPARKVSPPPPERKGDKPTAKRSAPTVAEDPTALYEAAHAAHFREGSPARALSAWDRYLAVAPADDPFMADARYNRAICLVRLARYDQARVALRPFAEGAHGGYRQTEARALLERIDVLVKRETSERRGPF
jgi:hypothetical protein